MAHTFQLGSFVLEVRFELTASVLRGRPIGLYGIPAKNVAATRATVLRLLS